MEDRHYYHLCADGDDAHNFIVSQQDFEAAVNLVAVCAANTDVTVVCFSEEDSHPHLLLFGTYSSCLQFKEMYETSYTCHIVQTRGSKDDVTLDLEILLITDEEYLMNTGTYIVVQPTKDGKDVMPFDYRWGSGCLYFRREPFTPVWMFDDKGKISEPVRFGDLTERKKKALLCSRKTVPDDWLVCNGVILPSNYIDVKRFESIYKTCNRYRAFLSAGKKRDEPILAKMAEARGISLEDMEARRLCGNTCKEMFGIGDVRKLSATQRASLARELRKRYRISFRQLAVITRLPESEIRKYVH